MSDILELLATRHSEDVFVPECKSGSSQFSDCPRLDAWAMACSWTKPRTWGYEIKVTRADFFGDDKWQNYLPYCNQLLFVVPWGLVRPEEVPGGCGLLWASKSLTRLYSKRKAEFRDIDESAEFQQLLKYVLMRYLGGAIDEDATERWARALRELAAKKESWRIGQEVGVRIAKRADGEIRQIEKDNAQLEQENKRLALAKPILESLGIDSAAYVYDMEREIGRRLASLNGGNLSGQLQAVEQACAKAREQLSEQQAGASDEH